MFSLSFYFLSPAQFGARQCVNIVISVATVNLIVPSGRFGSPTLPTYVSEVLRPNESVERSPVLHESKSNWKSTTLSTAKLLLRGVRDSSDVFTPLKSLAGVLHFILDSYEVRPLLSRTYYPQHSHVPQRTKANKQAIETLALRIQTLAELLCTPAPEGDSKEEDRRRRLEW